MLTAIKRWDSKKVLVIYCVIAPVLILGYLYLTTLHTGAGFDVLLLDPFFALSFLTACFSLLQSWYIQQFQGKVLKRYLQLLLVSQLLSLNILGAVLVGWNLLQGDFTQKYVGAKIVLISGFGLLLLAIAVTALLVF